jgi:hypothetical protein
VVTPRESVDRFISPSSSSHEEDREADSDGDDTGQDDSEA